MKINFTFCSNIFTHSIRMRFTQMSLCFASYFSFFMLAIWLANLNDEQKKLLKFLFSVFNSNKYKKNSWTLQTLLYHTRWFWTQFIWWDILINWAKKFEFFGFTEIISFHPIPLSRSLFSSIERKKIFFFSFSMLPLISHENLVWRLTRAPIQLQCHLFEYSVRNDAHQQMNLC